MRSLLVLASIAFLVACNGNKNLEPMKAKSFTSIQASAEIVSLEEIPITPPNIPRTWEYKIEFLARENIVVNKGSVLVKFDDQRLSKTLIERKSAMNAAVKEAEKQKIESTAKLEQLALDLAEAKMNLEKARRKVEISDSSRSNIERKKQRADFIIATELHNQASNRINRHKKLVLVSEQIQQAKINKAQAKVNETERNILQLNIKAPKSGMVTLHKNFDGNKPAVGDTVFMGAKLLSLTSIEMLAAKAEFDESDTSLVSIGAPVKLTLDAHPERSFAGTITEISQSYRLKSSNNPKVVFDVWATLETIDSDTMKPGMKATIELLQSKS